MPNSMLFPPSATHLAAEWTALHVQKPAMASVWSRGGGQPQVDTRLAGWAALQGLPYMACMQGVLSSPVPAGT